MSTQPPATKKAWFHVDMDGLDAIYHGQRLSYRGERDEFYTSAVENSLAFFRQEGITATYFVIAKDLDDDVKRQAIEEIVRAGHNISGHSLNHLYLNKIDSASKREEIFAAKRKIEDTLGVPCQGFRAPGYSIDCESLELLREAGYRYDSSVFPNSHFRKRLGMDRILREPFLVFPEDDFFEVPMPYLGPLLPPFHPCYAFYLSRFYFNRSLDAFKKRHNYLTLLFHLTDFATRQKLDQGFKLNVFTNNFYTKETKLSFLTKLVARVRSGFSFTTTEDFLSEWAQSVPELNPRTIPGVSTTHETGASVVKDREIISAINEERLKRRKLDHGSAEPTLSEEIKAASAG